MLKLALKALRRNKLRSLLTMLGVIIGVAAVITIGALGEASRINIHQSLSSLGSHLIIILPNSADAGGARLQGANIATLTNKDIEVMQQEAMLITGISPDVQARGQAINGSLNWPANIEGVNEQFLNIKNMHIKEGIPFSERDVRTYAKVCLLGQTVVDNIFPKGTNPIGKTIRFNKIPFKVIGVIDRKGQNTFGQDQDDVIIAPYTTVQKRITATNYFGSIFASAKSEALSFPAAAELTNILRTAHRLGKNAENDFVIRTQAELIQTVGNVTGLLTILLTAIAGISLLIGGIGIMNIMYVSVTERTREIGLRMSIGARGIDILQQFLTEAILISLTGGIIGIVLGESISLLVVHILGWPPVVSQRSIILSFTVCSFIGVFFGYYPAQKASRLDPIEALRYE